MNINELFDRIVQTVKTKGVYDKNSKYRDEYHLKLANGVDVMVAIEDAGYCYMLYVKGLVNAIHPYMQDVQYCGNIGNDNAVLTVAKMLGVAKEPTLHDLVEEYHECNCKWNHTDGCSWFYEINKGIHNWNGRAHKEWLEKYLKEVRPLT